LVIPPLGEPIVKVELNRLKGKFLDALLFFRRRL